MKHELKPLEPDDTFLISGEMIEGRGEDSFYAACEEYTAVSAVFDGCGGIGSRKYARYSGCSGAYMSARAVSGAMHDWFHDFEGGIAMEPEEIRETMKSCFQNAVGLLRRIGDEPSKIAGMLVRDFPTTAAVALVRSTGQGMELHCLWAGDSRIYLLDGDGLAQLTADDVADQDAMNNLRADGALTNLVAADRDFVLHHRVLPLHTPVLVFAATDGCFGYLPTPMEFEDLFLSALLEADCPSSFAGKLQEEIREVAGDDYTLGCMCFGFGTFPALQKQMKRRKAELDRCFIKPLREEDTEERAQQLWLSYRKDYLRFLHT